MTEERSKNKKSLRIALCQVNPMVGDLSRNRDKIDKIRKDYAGKVDVFLFPELFLCGYPCDDLLLRPSFVKECEEKIASLHQSLQGSCLVIGHPCYDQEEKLLNGVSVLEADKSCKTYAKKFLPNTGVFDEKRYFSAGKKTLTFKYKDYCFGLCICQDMWEEEPVLENCRAGAEIILVLNASPYSYSKHQKRLEIAKALAKKNKITLVYLNMVGGHDEMVFDGGSFVVSQNAQVVEQMPFFKEAVLTVDLSDLNQEKKVSYKPSYAEEVSQALCLGIYDYVHKNSFKKVLLGLSGGIDSSLTAVLATRALGVENVLSIYLPSKHSSQLSLELAQEQARLLDIEMLQFPIDSMCEEFERNFETRLNKLSSLSEQNLQARLRALILMSIANEKNLLLLNTSNRSEIAVGYSTLYGDASGAFAVLKDVYKSQVWQISRFLNQSKKLIPEAVIEREPTAELKAEQKDSDDLPDYKLLDEILVFYLEQKLSCKEIIKKGLAKEIVEKIILRIHQSEFKRFQAPPGIRLHPEAFGRDRRYPLTHTYRN